MVTDWNVWGCPETATLPCLSTQVREDSGMEVGCGLQLRKGLLCCECRLSGPLSGGREGQRDRDRDTRPMMPRETQERAATPPNPCRTSPRACAFQGRIGPCLEEAGLQPPGLGGVLKPGRVRG